MTYQYAECREIIIMTGSMCGQQKIKWCHFAVMLRMDKAVLVCQFVIKCNCGVSISKFLCSLSFHVLLTTTIVLGWQVAKPHTIDANIYLIDILHNMPKCVIR